MYPLFIRVSTFARALNKVHSFKMKSTISSDLSLCEVLFEVLGFVVVDVVFCFLP